MKFETNPQLILDLEEWSTLDKALKLCRDMDCETTVITCACCPKKDECNGLECECPFVIAHKALKEIVDMAIIK